MSFDKDTRNALAKMVATCRRLLTEDVTDQLRGRFGMHPDGTILSIDRLDLAEDEKLGAEALRELLEHFAAGEAGRAEDRRRNAYERLVLEISFTALNRLAALRLCEERDLVVECVRQGTASAGFQMFERVSGGALGTRYQTYRVFLECLFDELALDLGVLFDRSTPQSVVFPGERCLTDVLAELNKPELAHLWAADETIGWIYQYFNPPEERKAMRDASQAPRNSRELAVRNQFFTPRYVVEFLTDNTLGRIWYEMRKGETSLKEECRYLVRRPNEVFLAPGEKAPDTSDDHVDLSQEELLKQPVYIEHRPKKDPRDLRVLDPACGSGHFLLYAFDLLDRIYEEAWEDSGVPPLGATGKALREEYKSLDDLRRAAPKLIIEHNLHGIDIDPRAVQIAALALWLRAQKAWKAQGLKPLERPRIERSNIVTAEPMPGEEDMRREFTAGLKPRVLGQLVDVVFEKMKLASEAGSLLKIEEEIKDVVAAAKAEFVAEQRRRRDAAGYLPGMAPPREATLFDFTDLSEEEFWGNAEDLILAALKEYAEQTENGRAVRRRLFAEDAARGFALIDLCRKRYDVVLMNPPFGKTSRGSDSYIRGAYPDNWKDIYAAFVERGWGLQGPRGRLGAITSSLFLYSKQLRELRRTLISKPMLFALAELGSGVLDTATVDTALTIHASDGGPLGSFIDLTNVEDKGAELLHAIGNSSLTLLPLDSFLHLRNWPLCYHLDKRLLGLWEAEETLEPDLAEVVAGNHTFDDERFVRLRFEVHAASIGTLWWPYEKGGSFQLFVSPTELVVNWQDDGREMRENQISRYGTDAQVIQSITWWFKPGITYPRVSSIGFGPRVLSAGQMFSEKGMCIFPRRSDDALPLLSLLVSSWAEDLLCAFGRHRAYENSAVASLPFGRTVVRDGRNVLSEAARHAVQAMLEMESGQETSPFFRSPLGLGEDGKIEASCRERLLDRVRSSCDRIDSAVTDCLFGQVEAPPLTSAKRSSLLTCCEIFQSGGKAALAGEVLQYLVGTTLGRWDVRVCMDRALASVARDPFAPLPVCPPGMLVGPDGLPVKPGGIVSEEWLRARPDANSLPPDGSVSKPTIADSEYPLRIDWDGILVDDAGVNGNQPHRGDIVRRVREVLDLLWKDKAHAIEREACEILGVKELRDYFRRPAGFFQDHLKRYSKSRRKAPIYWPLSTASGSYTIWIYYHRLTDQTLYTAVNKYLEPKIAEVERAIGRIEKNLDGASGRQATQLRDRLNEGRALAGELRDLREELLRIAALPYKPNLNDGVIINAAPFHKLFRLRSWAKDTEKVWKKLEKGDYDWAHLAYTLWPDRVKEVCRNDRSIAVAHGLEELCEVEAPVSKRRGKKRGRKKKKEVGQ